MAKMNNPLTQEQVTQLLGRSLSTTETTNFDLYLNIAKLRLEDLTCLKIDELAEMPDDLALVWARFFGVMSAEATEMQSSGVASKRVEDFQIAYRDDHSVLLDLIDRNGAIIAKYSACGSGIRHGRTIFDSGGFGDDCI